MTDGERIANADNPNGYYEFEAVKRTKEDPSWLTEAPGKAVKMVYRLLYDLPDKYDYQVVFMRREMDEILASQKKMLQREGKTSDVSDEMIANLFESEMQKCRDWIAATPYVSAIEVSYNALMSNTRDTVESICQFLDCELDSEKMVTVIDPSLYRNRVTF